MACNVSVQRSVNEGCYWRESHSHAMHPWKVERPPSLCRNWTTECSPGCTCVTVVCGWWFQVNLTWITIATAEFPGSFGYWYNDQAGYISLICQSGVLIVPHVNKNKSESVTSRTPGISRNTQILKPRTCPDDRPQNMSGLDLGSQKICNFVHTFGSRLDFL